MSKRKAVTVTLEDFLTEAQITHCKRIITKTTSSSQATEIAEKVMTPNMTEINKKLGQENDAKYLAYIAIYLLGQPSASWRM